MSLRTAVYARYSSDRQSPASIQDQLRKCREYAVEHQWKFQDDHVYTDEAVSGAGADRPGLLKLMSAAGQQLRPFDIALANWIATIRPSPITWEMSRGWPRGSSSMVSAS